MPDKLPQEIKIICDLRERPCQINCELLTLMTPEICVSIDFQKLEVGDYILGDGVIAERKSVADLEASIIDGRIFSQLENLQKVKKPCIIVEGNLDSLLCNNGRIHNKAIIGLLTSIGLNYKIPIFFTKNIKETALYLYLIAKREQIANGNNHLRHRYSKTKMSLQSRQLFILESFPDVGPALAESLLNKFKTIKKIANASIDDLQEVDKLGPKKAKKIKHLFEAKFDKTNDEEDN